MATDIVLMNQGEIKQVDSPEKIYNDPDNLFAAQFIGTPTMNLFNQHGRREPSRHHKERG